ncbi:MAG: hypothetical protein ACLFQV_11315 [Vulcanimicrobiota bacterium]
MKKSTIILIVILVLIGAFRFYIYVQEKNKPEPASIRHTHSDSRREGSNGQLPSKMAIKSAGLTLKPVSEDVNGKVIVSAECKAGLEKIVDMKIEGMSPNTVYSIWVQDDNLLMGLGEPNANIVKTDESGNAIYKGKVNKWKFGEWDNIVLYKHKDNKEDNFARDNLELEMFSKEFMRCTPKGMPKASTNLLEEITGEEMYVEAPSDKTPLTPVMEDNEQKPGDGGQKEPIPETSPESEEAKNK